MKAQINAVILKREKTNLVHVFCQIGKENQDTHMDFYDEKLLLSCFTSISAWC